MENNEVELNHFFKDADIENVFKSYGNLFTDAINIDYSGLINCFDEFLLSFDNYDLQLEEVFMS